MTDDALVMAALFYAQQGWPVFPCWPPRDGACRCGKAECDENGKTPCGRLVPHGSNDASTDPDVIRRWWAAVPDANIGLKMGNGLCAVDFDFYNGGDVAQEILETEHGRLPYSLRARTGSGQGLHVFLTYPKGCEIRSGNGKLGGGVDIKADGGYVIAPPSRHRSGGRYEWLDEGETTIEPMPAWMFERLRQAPKVPGNGKPAFEGTLTEENARKVGDWLFPQYTDEKALARGRHDSWKLFAMQCRINGVPYEVHISYLDAFLDWANRTGRERRVEQKELVRLSQKWAYVPGKLDGMEPLDLVRDLLVAQEEGNKPPAVFREDGAPKIAEWLSMGEALRQQKNVSTRYRTGFPTFDSLLRGGIPATKLCVLVGRPGSGKTGLAIQVALNMYGQAPDVCVAMYMADEGLGPAVIRAAQRFGYAREQLEAAEAAILAEAATELDRLDRVFCMNPDAPGASIEKFLAGAEERAAGRPLVLVVDSVQVVRSEASKGKDRRVTAAEVSELVSSTGRRLGAVTLLLSQSNRAAYKNKRETDNADPLSAASESGVIEHMADVLFFLCPDGDTGRVKAQVPKNRVGGRIRLTPIYLEWDERLASFRELDDLEMSKEQEAAVTEKATAKLWAAGKRILGVLKKHPAGLTTRNVGVKAALNGVHLSEALAFLEEKDLVFSAENQGRGGGLLWRAGEKDEEER